MSGAHPDPATASSTASARTGYTSVPRKHQPHSALTHTAPLCADTRHSLVNHAARTGYTSVTREQRRDLLDRRAGANRHLPVEILTQKTLVIRGLQEVLLVEFAPKHGMLAKVQGFVT